MPLGFHEKVRCTGLAMPGRQVTMLDQGDETDKLSSPRSKQREAAASRARREPPAKIVRLHLPDGNLAPAAKTPAVFETIRIVDLARLRAALRRQTASLARKGGEGATLPVERAALLALLEDIHADPHREWPDVVVIERPQTGALRTNFSVVGPSIFLAAHLSRDWAEGREDPGFYLTLRQAVGEWLKVSQSRFETLPSRT